MNIIYKVVVRLQRRSRGSLDDAAYFAVIYDAIKMLPEIKINKVNEAKNSCESIQDLSLK